jgi:hypothetical protein
MYGFLAGLLVLTSLTHSFGAEAAKGIDVVGTHAAGKEESGGRTRLCICGVLCQY